jgi:hypothetical protein
MPVAHADWPRRLNRSARNRELEIAEANRNEDRNIAKESTVSLTGAEPMLLFVAVKSKTGIIDVAG